MINKCLSSRIEQNLKYLKEIVMKGTVENNLQTEDYERQVHIDNVNTFLSYAILADMRDY